MMIPFSPPDITALEEEYVIKALRSGWITTGPMTKEFERRLAETVGTTTCICLNSATAAMELTLLAFGIGKGDEVIVPAYTYTATAAVVCHVGAKPVMVDVKPDTFEMSPDALRDAITERTKAVIPVDIGGVLCDYPALYQVLEEKKDLYRPSTDMQRLFDRVMIIADSAHAFGSSQHGTMSGAIADVTCFSFHAVKNLTSAEGGAITWRPLKGLDDEAMYNHLQLLSLHGQSKDAMSKMELGSWEYDILFPGQKCNMTDVLAALGMAQLERFEWMTKKRRSIIKAYDDAFLPLGVKSLQHTGKDFVSNGHLYLARIPGIKEARRNQVIKDMAAAGIACNVHFKPLPMFTAYKNLGFDIKDFPESYKMYENVITLPSHPQLHEEEIAYVIEHFSALVKEATTSSKA